MMERIVVWGILAVSVLALIITFYIGFTHSPKQNKQYDRSRTKTVIVLTLIYIVALVVGGLLIIPWL